MTWAFGIAGALTGGYFQGHEEVAWTRRLDNAANIVPIMELCGMPHPA